MDIPSLSDWTYKKKRDTAWSTESEQVFIDKLGSYSEACLDMGRRYLLKQYKIGLQKRTNWFGLDKEAVLKHLEAAQRRTG